MSYNEQWSFNIYMYFISRALNYRSNLNLLRNHARSIIDILNPLKAFKYVKIMYQHTCNIINFINMCRFIISSC